ncbi:DUF3560 domain-containing protein [Herbiconiux sp. L3-i23]|uniref:DUF3560 domain-containing protein n=1 Tax=Herbiconiux sp. L3-i23 TaxID=2905871 RepID=UPI00205157F5|nr:DUF3560 domain-containing protein [Herbiconiux sp. L3-i23]BDI22998.1 hypothetical protein L3i23_17740 [Herbiconiux sp. L3-i23]
MHTINRAAQALRAAGFEVTAEVDETLRPAAEVEAAKIERQAARVEALDARANRREADAATADQAARNAVDRLPWGGEPIKVGHHSESRHRNAIAKADAAMGRSVKVDEDATRARARVAAAARTTDNRYAPAMVARRIERLERDI